MKRLLVSLLLPLGLVACAGLPAPTEPATQRLVAEDDQVRIEELRVRGQTQRVTVQPKQGGKTYDIVQPPGGQDPSQGRGTSGQRVWPVLSF